MSCNNADFLRCRIEKLQKIIIAYDDAFLALATGVQEYTLDTGQGRQTVKRQDIDKMQETKRAIVSELDDLCAQLNGTNGGVVQVRPRF